MRSEKRPDAKLGAVRVRLETALGALIIEVYPARAPVSAGAFLRFVDEGRYVSATFSRSVRSDNDNGTPPIQVIQAMIADPENDPIFVAHEPTQLTGLQHLDGTVSLARRDVGTGSPGAIFICIGDQPALDYGGMRNPDGQGFAAFGRVLEGMEVARRIQQAPTKPDAPIAQLKGQMIAEPIAILTVRRVDSL